jgi:hypothetical protein
MAFRRPLKLDGGNLKEMSDAELTEIKKLCLQLYVASKSVNLSVVSSAGNLQSSKDTRMAAGAYKTSTTAYPAESVTPEPYVVTVTYDRFNQTTSTVSDIADNNNDTAFPLYYDANGNLAHMSKTDMYDTFIKPALTYIQQKDVYYVSSNYNFTGTITDGSELATYSRISTTNVYRDTRANTGAYTAGGIPEAADQPTTITNYYLFGATASTYVSVALPLTVDTNGNPNEMSAANWRTMLQTGVKYAAVNTTDYRLRYGVNVSGNTQGSGWADTRLNGSGNYQTRFVNADDYRAQEFPNGSATTISNYYLRQYLV